MNQKLYFADFHFFEIVAKDADEIAAFLQSIYYKSDKCTVLETQESGTSILEMTFAAETEGVTDSFFFDVAVSSDSSLKNLWTVKPKQDEAAAKRIKNAQKRQNAVNKKYEKLQAQNNF